MNGTTTARRGDWIATYSGRQFWPLDVRSEDLEIRDIAHALALQCRFNGHTRAFYSVGEHSVRASHACPEHALWGLLHDAPEAYIGDMVRPLKKSPGLEEYCRIDERITAAVAERFGLPMPIPQAVIDADNAILHAEARDLLQPCRNQWWSAEQADPGLIVPWTAPVAELRFLERFAALAGVAP